ncbi:MAG TPA: hypothetical protein VKP30_31235, partial [Polyangiaceae bacterium]|nr:hypothetical protein [Polyangiaceae bacterium]
VLSRVKLIAEPWDIGPGGYRLGGFPPGWAEWNGRYRDCVRRFWRADDGQIAELASRLSGSSDIFLQSGRGPLASINFVTCHDGFTLNDLVSYDKKHNLANGEDNRDGQDDNFSRNWGVEGDTSTPTIVRIRERMRKNFLATLALSQGVPMLTQGDEFGRTQHGNNNAYCQDRPLSWLDWSLASKNADFLEFARELFRVLRPRNELLRRRHYFRGRVVGPDSKEYRDVTWLRADGREMQEEDWMSPKNRTLGMLIRGDFPESTSGLAGPTHSQPDSALYLFLNASHRAKTFVIPTVGSRGVWREIINTAQVPRRLAKTKLLSCAPHALNLLSYEWTTG